MFRKLLKHEWKATAPTLGILNLAVLVTSVVAALLLRFDEIRYDGPFAIILAMVMVFALIAAVVCAVAAEILLLVRFYKSRFTDQGYLTFTLPVSAHQVFLSSALNMLFWTLITGIVLIGSFTLFCVIGLGEAITAIYEEFQNLTSFMDPYDSYVSTSQTAYQWAVIGQAVVSIPCSIVTLQTCITVGAVIAKKHKVLASFGAYYVLSFITSTVTSMLAQVIGASYMDYLLYSSFDLMYGVLIKQILWISIPMDLVLMVGCYFLSTWLMKRKLNLP